MKRILCVALTLVLLFPILTLAEETYTARAVFDMLQAGDYASVYALFDQMMRNAMTENDLRKAFSDLEAAFGKVTGIGEEETAGPLPYRNTFLPVYYEKASFSLEVIWQENRIVGLYFSLLKEEAPGQEDLPEGMTEESIQVGDPALEGLLTLPDDVSKPLPAVVLVHGSGPSDRDETMGQGKPFRDLAYGLAGQGIAVLRYDKRTYVYGDSYTREDLITFTVKEETINDAVAAAQILRTDPRLDPDRIYLVGHSMGAMLAPRIAQENPGLFAGVILLSGTPKTLAGIVLSQNQALVDAMSPLEKIVGNMQMAGLRQSWQNVLNGTAEEAKGKMLFGQPAYYFWEMAQYDTAEILKNLDIPSLIINGGSDFQVIDADGIDAWRALELPESVQLSYYPELNHLLMDPQAPETIRGTMQEYDIPCHLAQEIVDEITAFILK